MRLLIQRVRHASVTVAGEVVAHIGVGFLILVGVTHNDGPEQAEWLAHKVAGLRLFDDEQGLMNRSLQDVGGEALVVSQFTLYGDARKGRRPSWSRAARPEQAEPLVQHFAQALQAQGVPVQQGVFGAHMAVALLNDGPVTLLVEREA